MPLILRKNIDDRANLGVWQIAEPESFFLEGTGIGPAISHPRKRLQHLAGRLLIRELAPGLPLAAIRPSSSGKPIAGHDHPHFSISHCGLLAAAVVSMDHAVGIDIESPREKILSISHKFLTPEENIILLNALQDPVAAYTCGWCIKEALFKWNGERLIDFRTHMKIRDVALHEERFTATCEMRKGNHLVLQAAGCKIGDAFLCWVIR